MELRVAGLALALSILAAPAAAGDLTLDARGNEPFWRLTIALDSIELSSLSPELAFKADTFTRESVDGKARVTATSDGRRLVVTADERLCADSMTGMPFPVTVSLEIDGRRLEGCAGDTATVLEGGWRVIRLEDDPLPTEPGISVAFDRDGKVSGKGGCNRFTGSYELTGESLSFGPLAATRMACPAPVMAVEARVFELMGTVSRVTPGDGRQLRLMSADRQVLVLDRVD
jgi:heat shock protein HslJ/uncharacterized membrane protein